MFSRRVTVFAGTLSIGLLLGASAAAKQMDFKDRLLGRWTPDKEKTKKYASEHEDAQAFPADVLDSLPNMWLEFDKSGSAKAHIDETPPNGESATLEGKWEIIAEQDQNHADVKITMNVGDRDDPKSGKAEFLDDDTLLIAFENDPVIIFVRTDKGKDEPTDSTGEGEEPKGGSGGGNSLPP